MAMDAPCLHTIPNAIEYTAAAADAGTAAAGGVRGAPELRVFAPRAAFAPPNGRLLLVADFKQFELRMMLHFAGDAALCDALIGADAVGDPFVLLAARWCAKAPGAVTEAERTRAKSITYALLYGKGTHSLAHDMGFSVAEAVALVDAFKASVPGVTAWLARVVAEAREKEPEPYVSTLAGRRRALPHLNAQVSPCMRPCDALVRLWVRAVSVC
jgi:DNA polymerase I-like protein with 3'-5' exonuclease and polymerase domains